MFEHVTVAVAAADEKVSFCRRLMITICPNSTTMMITIRRQSQNPTTPPIHHPPVAQKMDILFTPIPNLFDFDNKSKLNDWMQTS